MAEDTLGRGLTFHDHIARNKRATIGVVAFMGVLLLVTLLVAGFLLGLDPVSSLVIGLIATAAYLGVTYSFSVESVIRATGVRPANPNVREEKLLIYRVEELALAAGLPKPRVYVQDSKNINAFATGRTPEEGLVCVTTGALALLDQEELEGVIAHELAHIANYDIRLVTVTVAVVGAIALVSEIVLRVMFWTGGRGGRGRGSGGGGGAGMLVLVIVGIALAILAPLLSRLVYLMLSRRREYLADATGAKFTRNPEGLARALEKIRGDVPDDPKGSRTVAGLYIANPFTRQNVESAFATHPPLESRIKRLKSM